jgi:Uma2 family endonuclease
MATALKLGPADHGRPMSLQEFLAGDYQEGSLYELIDGRLYVSPLPDPPENVVEQWLHFKLKLYSRDHPAVVNYVTNKARVFVPGRPRATALEPDVAVYRKFPLDRPLRELRWQELSPLLVAEVLSKDDPAKDLVRNVDLYLQVPSIKEYWLLDTREDPELPGMRVYRRRRTRWRILEVVPGATYTTPLLPGFKLTLDPRS